jgi:hypothetical protein
VHIVCYCCYFGLLLYFFEGHVIDTCGRDFMYVKICSSYLTFSVQIFGNCWYKQ